MIPSPFPPLSGSRSPLVRLALAGGLFALAATAGAQDGPDAADASEPTALGGACVANASLGELSLAPADDAAALMPDAGSAAPAGSAGDLPAYDAVMPEGFVSLAGNAPPLAASCVLGGAPAGPAEAPADQIAAAAEVAPPPEPEIAPEPVAETPPATVAAVKPSPKSAAPHPRPRKPPAEALKTWWPAAEAGKLNLRFAGEAAFGEAIALLFDAPFSDPSSLAQHVEVKNRSGKPIEGKWQVVKSNPQMVALRVPPGLYEVRIGDSLAAANGLRFQRTAEGKIFVR